MPPQYFDLKILVDEINKAKPKNVIEYGSGWSTYVISETLKRIGGDWQLISIELDNSWRDISEARIDAGLESRVSIRTAKSEVWIYGSEPFTSKGLWYRSRKGGKRQFGIAAIVFPEMHEMVPDFVYLDGPASDQVNGFRETHTDMPFKPLVADPLFFKGAFTLVVDSRRANCAFLAANFNRVFKAKIFQQNHFTVFNVMPQTLREGQAPQKVS